MIGKVSNTALSLAVSAAILASCYGYEDHSEVENTTPAHATVPARTDSSQSLVIPDDIQPDLELNITYRDENTNSITREQIDEFRRRVPSMTLQDLSDAYEYVSAAHPELPTKNNEFVFLMVDFMEERQKSWWKRFVY